jgi:hypothetical protein
MKLAIVAAIVIVAALLLIRLFDWLLCLLFVHVEAHTNDADLWDDEGSQIAEFAVLLPVWVFVAFVLIDIQWMTGVASNVAYVATETARCEAIMAPACAMPQSYAAELAQGVRLNTNADVFQVSAPPCNNNQCTDTITYKYQPLGVWFPAITITRTGTSAQAPSQ